MAKRKKGKGEIYSGKLIDFKVICDKKEIGVVTEIIDTPANEVIRIGEKILIPEYIEIEL